MNGNIEMAHLDWLQDDSDFMASLTGTVVQLGHLTSTSRVIAWGADSFDLVSSLCEKTGAQAILCAASHMDLMRAEALYPFAQILSMREAPDRLTGKPADLLLACGTQGNGTPSTETFQMWERMLSPKGRMMFAGMPKDTQPQGLMARYFPVSSSSVGAAIAATDTLTTMAMAMGFQTEIIRMSTGGAVSMSPRLAAAIRTFGQMHLHEIGPEAYADGLDLLDADLRGRAFHCAGADVVLQCMNRAGDVSQFPQSA